MAGLDSLGVEADGVHVLPTSTVSRSLQHVARVADAAVRLVALLIVALVLVVPSVVVLLTALFKADAREYAGLLLDRMIDLFKTILDGQPDRPDPGSTVAEAESTSGSSTAPATSAG
jgi:hypothetical protein